MSFQTRAVESCIRDFESGIIVETHVQDVLSCNSVDVSRIVEFLDAPEQEVKISASRIVAEKGDIGFVVKVAMVEEDREVLIELLSIIGKKEAGLDSLVMLLDSDDTMVRDATVEMFRKAGQPNNLFPLMFDQDNNVVKRIKRYINEAG